MPEANKVFVRLAHLTDLPQLMRLQDQAAESMSAGQYSQDQMQSFLQHTGAVDVRMVVEGRFYVAEIVDRIVGCGGWWPTERRPVVRTLDGSFDGVEGDVVRAATMRGLFVDPSARHHGVAHRLMTTIMRAAQAQGIERFEVMSPAPAQGFFADLGYDPVERFSLTMQKGLEIPLVHMVMQESGVRRGPMPAAPYHMALL